MLADVKPVSHDVVLAMPWNCMLALSMCIEPFQT